MKWIDMWNPFTMTEREREEQRLDFAYGSLACSTNHKPSRKAFRVVALEERGWTEEEFERWASEREWERE